MQVNRAATMNIVTVDADDTVYEIARKMGVDKVGFLPVLNESKLVGVVTDRDLVVRCIGEGRSPLWTKASDVMSGPAHWIYEDARVEDAAQEMIRKKVRRLVVKNHLGGAVGVITLDDVARFTHGSSLSGRVLNEVARKSPAGVAAAMSAFDYEE